MGGLSSSIHTIHRPVARSRRFTASGWNEGDLRSRDPLVEEPDSMLSEDEIEHEDFEETPRPPDIRPAHVKHTSLQPSGVHGYGDKAQRNPFQAMNLRTGSMATVRLHRRTRLAEKLKDVFELDGIKEVWAGMRLSNTPLFHT